MSKSDFQGDIPDSMFEPQKSGPGAGYPPGTIKDKPIFSSDDKSTLYKLVGMVAAGVALPHVLTALSGIPLKSTLTDKTRAGTGLVSKLKRMDETDVKYAPIGEYKDSGAAYEPGKHTIYAPKNVSPHVMAHELGHSEQFKEYPFVARATSIAGKLGMFGSLLASVKAATNPDDDYVKKWMLGAGLLSLPELGIELDASYRGYKKMREAGRSKAQSLKTFLGVPTYAALAVSPALIYLIRKKVGIDEFKNV